MSQRSPYNDRYKTDQKGKTRKSASSAKPKRAIADLTPSGPRSAAKKKKSLWERLRSPEPGSAAALVATPEMKRLRTAWWWLIGVALVAVAVISIPQLKLGGFALVGWVVYVGAMSGALYLEFGPLRKARLAAIEAAKSAKGSKSKRAAKAADKKGADEDGGE